MDAASIGVVLGLLAALGCHPVTRVAAPAATAAPTPPSARAEPVPIIVERSPRTIEAEPAGATPEPTGAIFVPALSVPDPGASSSLAVLSAPPPSEGTEPCRSLAFETDAVMRACEQGGLQAAKALMAQAVSKARARGVELSCGTCHVNQTDYALGPNALATLRRWL